MPIRRHFRRVRRRAFLLLEVLIGAFLIILCLVPFLEVQTAVYRQEGAIVTRYKVDSLFDAMHVHLVERLYHRDFSMEGLLSEIPLRALEDEPLVQEAEQLGYRPFYAFRFFMKQPVLTSAKQILVDLSIVLEPLRGAAKIERMYRVYLSLQEQEAVQAHDPGDLSIVEPEEE